MADWLIWLIKLNEERAVGFYPAFSAFCALSSQPSFLDEAAVLPHDLRQILKGWVVELIDGDIIELSCHGLWLRKL